MDRGNEKFICRVLRADVSTSFLWLKAWSLTQADNFYLLLFSQSLGHLNNTKETQLLSRSVRRRYFGSLSYFNLFRVIILLVLITMVHLSAYSFLLRSVCERPCLTKILIYNDSYAHVPFFYYYNLLRYYFIIHHRTIMQSAIYS